MTSRVAPVRFRRRLTVAFALVGGLAALVLAVGSYLVVREARLDSSRDAALEQARFNLVLAQEVGAGPDELLDALARRGLFDTVGVVGGETFSSSVSLGVEQVPEDVSALVDDGQLAYKRVDVGGARYLLAGGNVAGTEADLYFFFPEDELWDDLAQLRNVLLAGTLLVALLAGAVGWLVARRTLAPVARASDAARSLAEGLLETRLPVESEDEFGAWARSFNEMAEALDAKIRELSAAEERERRFTSDVAHELRTPLTALVAEAEALRAHLDAMPAEARRPAELLVGDVARLRRLVEDLMEISRLDASAEAVVVETVRLRALVDASVRARGWERVLAEGDDVEVESDRRRLERIVSNLVGNALEHGGGEARVVVSANGELAQVAVSDEGPGIAPADLPHVFERFYKADPARGGSGSGLGLAIAREHALALGGDIEVESEAGTGSTFMLRLPIVAKSLHGSDEGVSRGRDDRGGTEEEGSP
jgi:two-component system, OmpR family, sensor histidine kinase MtrB